MTDKDEILKKVLKTEDKLLVSKILDKINKAHKIHSLVNSDFLDPYQKNVVEKIVTSIKRVNYIFYGGYNGAERVLIIFSPNFIAIDEADNDFNLDYNTFFKVIKIKVKNGEKLTHRDYLGALMSIGIKRDKIGDILVRNDNGNSICDVIVLKEVSDFILYNIDKIGNLRAVTEPNDIKDLVPDKNEDSQVINTSVASMRLDCVVSSGYKISREKAAEAIKAERVNLNWEPVTNSSKQVKEGDTLSFKGKGRLIVERINCVTKKGRISVALKKL